MIPLCGAVVKSKHEWPCKMNQENIYACHEIPALSSIIIAEDFCCVLLHPTTQTTLFVHLCIYAVHYGKTG